MKARSLAWCLMAGFLGLAAWRFQVGLGLWGANGAAAYAERSVIAVSAKTTQVPRRLLDRNLARLEKAVKVDPLSLEVRLALASHYFLLSRWQQAEQGYLEALKIEDRPEVLTNLARLYLAMDRPSEALKTLERAEKLDYMVELEAKELKDAIIKRDQFRKQPPKEVFKNGFETGTTNRWTAPEEEKTP
jgi:tetratricopeptide (TPR) repeat protein